jgi:hypothetical protein
MTRGKLYEKLTHRPYLIGISGVIHIVNDTNQEFLDEAKAEMDKIGLADYGWYSSEDVDEFREWFKKWFGE